MIVDSVINKLKTMYASKESITNENDLEYIQNLEQLGLTAPNILSFINMFSTTLNEVYGEDKWSISFESNKARTWQNNGDITQIRRIFNIDVCLDIHFPNVTITNSKDHKLDITDLYVRIKFMNPVHTGAHSIRLQGTRGSISVPEWSQNYSHSHLSSSNEPGRFGDFCLGSGDIDDQLDALMLTLKEYQEVKVYKKDGNLDTILKEIDMRFTHMVLQIEPYVTWESLEGGPHITMDNVFLRGKQEILPVKLNEYSIFFNQIKHQLFSIHFDIPIRIHHKKYVVVDNSQFDEILKQAYTNTLRRLSELNHNWVVRKDRAGNYYPYEVEFTVDSLVQRSIYFNGEERPVHFTSVPDFIRNNYFIHPEIKQYVKNRIESLIEDTSVKKSLINRLQNSGNNT